VRISKIESKVRTLLLNITPNTFIYDLLDAYEKPKASIARLQKGSLNLSSKTGEIIWKKNLYFKKVGKDDLYSTLDQVSQNKQIRKHSPRFLIVTDYQTLLAIDTTTNDKLDVPIEKLPENYEFFLPLSGIEKALIYKENEADIKAAERMAKIYDELCKLNPNMRSGKRDQEDLNVFLSRLLFCFFAESTEIFEKKNQFTETISERTQEDGGDLQEFFCDLFDLLNKQKKERTGCHKWVINFPYVNGGLFKKQFKIPKFTQRLRKMIIDSGGSDWSSINTDIFGSMIQSVIDLDQRSRLGMHYTSVTNIMKVICPLFLDDLYRELENSKNHKRRLEKLCDRLAQIKIFDPACGSGNFLIVAYKELRKFEAKLLKYLELLGSPPDFISRVQLSQFYGIEIDEFACEIAKLSLWLAEHQMNMIYKKNFGKWASSLPLTKGGYIFCGNATRLDWEKICPEDQQAEIYLISNPPYLGTRNQTIDHKEDMAITFDGLKNYKNLDYISCWFYKGADYIKKTGAHLAFVSTSSISQGDQVSLLWSHILSKDIEIGFCHQPFKWTNNAKNKAGVSCVIIGLRPSSNNPKIIFSETHISKVDTINPYLTSGKRQPITRRSKPISKIPEMVYGNYTGGCGALIMSKEEMRHLIKEYPRAKKFIRKFVGSDEFINRIDRYCLWIKTSDFNEANSISEIKRRIKIVESERRRSPDPGIQKLSKRPHQFRDINESLKSSIVIPIVSSEKREYLPCGFLDKREIIPNSAQVIYDSDPYIFGIISSHIHTIWVKVTAGQLEARIRYSSSICYNNFPFPKINKKQKEQIHSHVLNVLSEREKYPEKTIAELYDPKKMPSGLRKAHQNLDAAVERCYRSKPFDSDEARLEHLFKLYEEMIQNEKEGK
jgi:hypothetical protein